MVKLKCSYVAYYIKQGQKGGLVYEKAIGVSHNSFDIKRIELTRKALVIARLELYLFICFVYEKLLANSGKQIQIRYLNYSINIILYYLIFVNIFGVEFA